MAERNSSPAPLAKTLRLTLIGLTQGESVYVRSHLRRADPSLQVEVCEVDRIAAATFDPGRVHALVFSTSALRSPIAADENILRASLRNSSARAFAIVSPESRSREIPLSLQALVKTTPDLSADSVAAEIVRFHRQASVSLALGPTVRVVYGALALCSYAAAVALTADYIVVRAGGASPLANWSAWRLPEVVTFFGAFFVAHCFAAILWILASAIRVPPEPLGLPRMMASAAFLLAAILVAIALVWQAPAIWILVLSAVVVLAIHFWALGFLLPRLEA